MVFSQYIVYLPYKIIWNFFKFTHKQPEVVFYCADYLDYLIFEPIQKYLPAIPIVAKNKKIQQELKKNGIKSTVLPSFPKVVIMARHSLHKFPEKKIIKIGMRHGAYHFKEFINPKKYNAFDLFLFTSEMEVEKANKLGIKCGKAVGFPKIDPLFNNFYTIKMLDKFKEKIRIKREKPILLFTATWNKSEMSAIDKWYRKLGRLTKYYNIIVSVHPWTNEHYKSVIRKTESVYLIEEKNVLPYLLIADLMISDTSSIIAEFCALDKPIITFRVPDTDRTSPEIKEMISEISLQIDSFNELFLAIEKSLKEKKACSKYQRK